MSLETVEMCLINTWLGLLLYGRLILSSLVWLQTKLDSTRSYYLYLFKIENMPNKNVEKVIKGSWSYVSWYLLSLLDQFTLNDFSGQCSKSANMGGGGGFPHSRSENTLRCTLKEYSCILNLQQCLDCKVASFLWQAYLNLALPTLDRAKALE